ncbi:hypothetical protein F4808DRAFT_57552 [Astrocystis sublimbata]|nr:hypothetical protein F4808DRAFT_57552 [Astrocystis sublimbata]
MSAQPSIAEAGIDASSPAASSRELPDQSNPESAVEAHEHSHTPDADADTSSSPSPSGDESAQSTSSADFDGPNASGQETISASASVTKGPSGDDSGAPPLPDEPAPAAQDDGWDCHWDQAHQAWFFYNRITNESTWNNPRVSSQHKTSNDDNTQLQTPPATAVPPLNEALPAGGYNPAIHGDYDPTAWYAKGGQEDDQLEGSVMDTATAYAAIGSFNRFTGRWQGDDQNPDRHNDEAKSRRQMNAFFDVDAAANAHDGRSLKAERSGKKPSKTELKHFKEKRRARKEEKRRAWLRD